MATVDRASAQDNNLSTPRSRATSKGPESSTVSIDSSDNRDDDLHKSTDGALGDKLKSRNSDDGRSDTSSAHRIRMSRMFKGRNKRRKSTTSHASQDSQLDPAEDTPPVPQLRRPGTEPRNYSDDSLGLHKSAASSLLTEDSDPDTTPAKRPQISPHQSHSGLLTLSSPLITSETIDSVGSTTDATLGDPLASEESPVRHTGTPVNNKRGVSPSPVGRLKEAFAPNRRPASPKAGDYADGARPGSSGGLGALFGGKKREAKILDQPITASPPQIHTGDGTQSTTSLRSTAPKRIITTLPATPPNLADAPTTLITPPTPTDGKPVSPTRPTSSQEGVKQNTSQSIPNVTVSPSGNMISHRRVRSATNPPSKLSNSITAPLTPHPEEAKTPGGTAFAPQNPGGFFASVFSAAQNAANNLSNTIVNNNTAKNKSNQQSQGEEEKDTEDGVEEVIGPESADQNADTEKRRPAVETLGSGNLSLAHLGITDTEVSPMSSSTNVATKTDEASAKAEDMAATQAVSAAYAADKPASVVNDRPRSHTANSGSSLPGAGSPQRQPEITDSPAQSSIQRQSSIRSRISDGRRRRHRGSSAATGNTIAAAITGSTSALAPSAAMNGNRLNGTGFAVASPKRNRDFHNFFKSVPEDDYLIEDYSAALQKEILLHGRLYVSEGHLCFSSNILGWVTNLVISFDEVVSVEKKSTAVLFPNAIVIQTLHARNVFASFLARDSTYDLIIGIWKISHPNLKSSLNGVTLDTGGTGDKTEKAESIGSDDGSLQESDDDVYDEDAEEDDGIGSFTEAGEGSMAGSEAGSVIGGEGQRKVSAAVSQAFGGSGEITEAAKAGTNGAAAAGQDFAGAATHGPTDCGDSDQHYDKLLIDTTIPAPLGKVHSLMFGPASGAFMRKWLIEDQKSTDLQMEDDKKGLGEDKKSFNYSYIKPLFAPVGPRQTKCNIAMTLEQYDLEKAITVLCSTGTPDVPSGSIFLTKTRYCLMWGANNSTRLIMTFTVEWSGKSWLRGPIEKGANDGQMSYATSLTTALRTAVTAKAAPARLGKGGKGKKRSKANILDETPAAVSAPTPANQAKQSDWGMLDPLRSLLGPVADILEFIFTPQIIIPLMGVLLMYSWFFRGASTAVGPNQWSAAQRQVAHDEIWRHEESELWKWLEDRVALDRVQSSVVGGRIHPDVDDQIRIPPANMKEREMDEAIRITEERLKVLKEKVEKDKAKTRTKSPREEQT
ncbi:hypothetical protein HBI56_152740 [Parastagonospora nodorum]|nr:hypothetical protein HBH53_154000 [Parastagonospora nodorum]KAH3960557.1 hypothetical protein HBH52_236000 [Parastagonospora nodorum]KAH3965084.1 hypothetical protein HBH51_153420 [Parastagonospora nodorum]KAH3995384.1 hypothetical protein HBI10_171470 [Parastagonospora nodorum]KAH4014454.1 hypothetical protein HBI09_210710 [Parastagonospora nodorum]